jgi:hypothetical protein
MTLGIKSAGYLLFTDADATTSKGWITAMSSQFTRKLLCVGYGGYEKIEKSFLNKLIRETLLTAIQYFSWAKAGLPYMV